MDLLDALQTAAELLVCNVHRTTPGVAYNDCDCAQCNAIRKAFAVMDTPRPEDPVAAELAGELAAERDELKKALRSNLRLILAVYDNPGQERTLMFGPSGQKHLEWVMSLLEAKP